MAANNQDELVRALAMLSSLRKNIEKMGLVPEEYVREYHTVLDRLEKMRIDVAEFRIQPSAMQSKPTAVLVSKHGNSNDYSQEKCIAGPFILTKLNALLGYFEIITSEKPKSIGFHPPEKQ